MTYLARSSIKLFSFTSYFLGEKHYKGYSGQRPLNLLGYYLAGLIEGDGSIILRKGTKEKTSPKIVFTFHFNEIPLYNKLRKILKTGVIYIENTGVCRYTISNADAVINLINQINGKFRTPKLAALNKAIDNINLWRGANLLKMPIDTGNLDNNPWLAGFIDADGHFAIKLSGSYKSNESIENAFLRGRVQCVFSMNQSEVNRISGKSNVPFMTNWPTFFK